MNKDYARKIKRRKANDMSKMIRKDKKTFKEYSLLFLIVSAIVCIVFCAYLWTDTKYLLSLNNDHLFQISQFYEEYARLLTGLKDGAMPFYSWNTFLGTNFFASKLYYCTGSIFFPLLLIFRNRILDFMLLETIMCVYISSFSMYAYLKEMGIKRRGVLITFSIIYSIGGGATIFFCYPMFHRFYAFLPLLFLGVEKYLKHGKLSLFSLIVCILFLQNYYLLFSVTVFLPFYFVWSCYKKDERRGFHFFDYLKKSCKLIISFIVGFFMSGVVVLPGIFFILGNTRLSYNELTGIMTWPLKTWTGLIYYSLIPIAQNLHIFNPFEEIMNTDNSGITYYYSIYNGVLSVIGILILIVDKKIKERKTLIFLLGLLFTFVMFLPLNSIMFAFTTPSTRATFILNFIIILCSAKVMDEEHDDDIYKKVGVSLVILCLFSTFLSIVLGYIKEQHINTVILLIIGVVIGLFSLFLMSKKKRLMVYMISILEVVFYATITISGQAYINKSEGISKEYIEYFKSIDEDKMYRQYIGYENFPPENASVLNRNVGMEYNFMSLYTYDSTYENSMKEFVVKTNSQLTDHLFDVSDPSIWKMLGVKYVGVVSEEELDTINKYSYAYDINHVRIYKLNDYNHIGHTYSKFINKKDIKSNVIDSGFDWNNVLIVDDSLYELTKDIVPSKKDQMIVSEQVNNNNVNAYISCDEKEVLFISIPYDKGWKILVDGIETDFFNVDYGFIGLLMDEGKHTIEMWYVPQGFKLGCAMSMLGFVVFLFLLITDLKNKNNYSL